MESKPYAGGIIRDIEISLPSNERIYKRSVDNSQEQSTTTEEPGTTEASTSEETSDGAFLEEDIILVSPDGDLLLLEPTDMDGAESGLVFRPLFAYRNRQIRRRRFGRSLPEGSIRSKRSSKLDDMEAAESSIVFRPLFRYRYVQKRRAERRRL